MTKLQASLNLNFKRIDRTQSDKNTRIIRYFLGVGQWAYATAEELRPFAKLYCGLPTNFLYVDYIYHLEEIYTKCFIAAIKYGTEDEAMVGRRGILTDFELSGGIGLDGQAGTGLASSETAYYVACHVSIRFETQAYEAYGDIMEAIACLVLAKYPKVAVPLATRIKYRLTTEEYGYGRHDTDNLARCRMKEKLAGIIARLNQEKVNLQAVS